MNSIIKTAARITEELSQPNEKNNTKEDGLQHTKARLVESLKKKWKNKGLREQYISSIDSLLVKKTHSSGCQRET